MASMLCCSEIMVSVIDSFQNALTVADPECSESWLGTFKQLITTLDSRSREVTSLINTISNSILTENPPPRNLMAPQLRPLTELIADLDESLLSPRRVCEPTFSALAAMEVTMALLIDDASQLLLETKKLIGEWDFLKDIVRNKDLPTDVGSVMATEID